jgi:hypothetical protein
MADSWQVKAVRKTLKVMKPYLMFLWMPIPGAKATESALAGLSMA